MLNRSSEPAELVVSIYESADAVRGHDSDTEKEDGDTKKDLDTDQHTGGDTAGGGCYRVTAVCLLLLCVLLLTAVTVLWIKFNNLNKENNQIQTSYNNLNMKRDQLQTSNNNLTIERDQLQTSYNNLTIERDQLQTSYKNLTIERDQLQTSYKNLTIERDQLQRERDEYLRTLCDFCKWKCFSFNSSIYYMPNESKSWTESRKDCTDKGADLVIINSREEHDVIVKQLLGSRAWIGLTDRDKEKDWKWVDGTPVTTTYWANGEPNDAGDEDCADVFSTSDGKPWNDNKCYVTQNWICEKRVTQ